MAQGMGPTLIMGRAHSRGCFSVVHRVSLVLVGLTDLADVSTVKARHLAITRTGSAVRKECIVHAASVLV